MDPSYEMQYKIHDSQEHQLWHRPGFKAGPHTLLATGPGTSSLISVPHP